MQQQHKKTFSEIQEVLSRIEYKKEPKWMIRLLEKGDGFLVQFIFLEKDLTSDSIELETQFCRKWYVSPYSTDSEIIGTIYKAIQAAELHEIAERFRYNDKMIFNPHMDYVELANYCDEIGMDVRIPKQ